MTKNWTKKSWRKFKVKQQPEYNDPVEFEEMLKKLDGFPPLVFPGEVENLKRQISDAGCGRRFILQGGDCAERFVDCNDRAIINKIKILLQMSVILTYGVRKPVVKIGRIAGQYSKPRSSPTETIDKQLIPTYRGDSINQYEPGLMQRTPDPKNLIKAYFHSAATLNFIRAMISGGFADLHHPYTWNLHSIEETKEWAKYKNTLDRILDAINFMESFGGVRNESLDKIDFFISHEGLLLGYEEALTRKDPSTQRYYNLGAHMLWIGERTRSIDEAHVEYFRGISNPIGIKVSHMIDKDELNDLIDILNPSNREDKIMLITRMGIEKVEKFLPGIVKSVKKSGKKVTWCCDPMHGNIIQTKGNIKTRNFDDILEEIKHTFRIIKDNNTCLGGLHFELTGDDVSECVGGATNLKVEDLNTNYETYCDPRLNYCQSMEMTFLLAELLGSQKD